jgi:NADH:ubiquinone oxidoreductase subunit H
MSPLMWALIIVIVIVVVALAALFASRHRTASLQQRYGPEYDRTVESATQCQQDEAVRVAG